MKTFIFMMETFKQLRDAHIEFENQFSAQALK